MGCRYVLDFVSMRAQDAALERHYKKYIADALYCLSARCVMRSAYAFPLSRITHGAEEEDADAIKQRIFEKLKGE